jgi:hypothetical protein
MTFMSSHEIEIGIEAMGLESDLLTMDGGTIQWLQTINMLDPEKLYELVEGGVMEFDNIEEHKTWLNQK